MSRITESQRMLIRSEVRHMLNRSLLREAADLSLRYTTTENGLDFYADNNSDTDYAYSRANDKVYSIDLSIGEEVLVPIPTGLVASGVVDAMKVADEQAKAAAAPAAPEPVAPAKRRRAPQEIVKQIQTALGMDGADANGFWGKATDAAWSAWLDAHSNITFDSGKTIEDLKTSWAKNSKYIKEINHFASLDTSSGTVENMLEFIKYAEEVADYVPDAQRPGSNAPTAKTEPMKVVAQGYNEIIAYANDQAQAALSKGDITLHDEWLAHADTARARQSQDTIVKSVAAANAKLDKELAYLKEIDPEDTFEFSDSALARTNATTPDKISESRWLRLAGLLKG